MNPGPTADFYRFDGSRPGARAIDKMIIRTEAIKEGWLKFDLSHLGIYLKGDIVATIELLPSGSTTPVMYEVKPGGRVKSFVRKSSQGAWQVPPHQYRMYVTALQPDNLIEITSDQQDAVPVFRRFSKAIQDSFSVFVRLPADYDKNSQRHYPVVYILDANVYFNYLSDSLDRVKGMQPLLVGIGYKDFIEMDSLRDRDFTYPPALPTDSFRISGGGERFYDFIRSELVPLVDSMYRTDKPGRTLMGHSLGGYFCLYALYKGLTDGLLVFRNYIAASPSVNYHESYLVKRFEVLSAPDNLTAKVYITWGEKEEEDARANNEYIDLLKDFTNTLPASKHINVEVRTNIYPGASHMEAALPTLYKGMAPRAIFGSK
jgi:predicted alpha/beta superfamily hydrolase/ketosteroid isomerase-like protein